MLFFLYSRPKEYASEKMVSINPSRIPKNKDIKKALFLYRLLNKRYRKKLITKAGVKYSKSAIIFPGFRRS
jgi:hypothetical protein